MGLKLNEAFVDQAYFIDSDGTELTGESPTCTIYDESDNTSSGSVSEIGNGMYKCSFTPDNAGIWKTRWRLTSGGVTYGEEHFFQAGQGQEDDILTDTNELQTDWVDGGRLDLLIDAIKAKTDNLPADPADDSDIDSQLSTIDAFHDVPTADTADNLVISDVVGNKTDTTGGDSVIALLKQIIVDTGTDIVADFDRHVVALDFWGDADNLVEITGGSTDINLPNVIIPTLPTGSTIWKVVLLFKCALIRDTSGSDNAINTAAAIRIKKSTGTWGVDDIVAYDIQDNSWAVDVSTSADRGGDAFIGNMNNDNLSGEVDAAATYNLRFEDIQADGANLQLHDVAVGLRVYIY